MGDGRLGHCQFRFGAFGLLGSGMVAAYEKDLL